MLASPVWDLIKLSELTLNGVCNGERQSGSLSRGCGVFFVVLPTEITTNACQSEQHGAIILIVEKPELIYLIY